MSDRNATVRSVGVLVVFASMAVPSASAQTVPSAPPAAAPAAAPALAGAAGPTLNIVGVPKPKKGKLYRFNLCTGQQFDATDISRVCNPADAAKTVTSAALGKPIVFRLAANAFLPPGCSLDGNGVIACAANADVSKLKSVRICAIQVGEIGSNFACTGQEVGFNKLTIRTPQPAKVAKSGGGSGAGTALKVAAGVGGAAAAAIVLKNALNELSTLDAAAASASTTTTTTTAAATGSRFAGTYNFTLVHGTSSTTYGGFWLVSTSGVISSPDRTITGTVTDGGVVSFRGPCWDSAGGIATWSGTMASASSGNGTFACNQNIIGGTWRVAR